MGRTLRTRRRRKTDVRSSKLDHEKELRSLKIWLKNQGWTSLCKLHVAEFTTTGRGLMAGTDIGSGDKLISIPCEALITTNTANLSAVGCLFHGTDNAFSAHEVLATFLIWERYLRDCSKWFPYLNTLPYNFTTPLFCADDETQTLPRHMLELLVLQKQQVIDAFVRISSIISSRKTCMCCDSHRFLELMETIFVQESFIWAWFVVNTRSVFYTVPLQNSSLPLIKISGKNCLALAPYLDLFNHSCDALVDIKVSHGSYDIISRSRYSKYSQVFIHYGPHSNLKLLLEYGFIVPCNPHDCIDVSFEEIVDSVKKTASTGFSCSQARYDYLLSHKLLENLFLNQEGLSFNARAVIFIVSLPDSMTVGYERVYYYDFVETELVTLCVTGRILVEMKRVEYQNIFSKMAEKPAEQCSSSFNMAKDLIIEYLKVLDKCEHSLSEMSGSQVK